MFDYAGRQFNGPQCAAAHDLDTMAGELSGLGLLPPPRYGAARRVVCGTAKRVSVREVLDDGMAGAVFTRSLCELVRQGIPVNLSAEDFRSEKSGVDSWQQFCEIVQDTLSSCELSTRNIGLCVHSHQMPLEAFRLVADAVLGPGPRYVFLDNLQMAAHGNSVVEQRAEANWSFLWRQRGMARSLMPVYGGIARSACPLLADEVAATVLPGPGLQAPVGSAWLPVMLPMTKFATPGGQIRWQLLLPAIRRSLAIAEQMLDLVSWHATDQQADAWKNRRLAISVTGLGDLVQQKGEDPTSLECLRWLVEVVTRIRSELYEQSGRIAATAGAIPALGEANHVSQWNAGPHRDSWRRHWEVAVRQSAVRHRNLLVLSPYSIIPSGASAAPAYSDLLPVIALADAWSFAGPPDFRGWNVAQFRHFHRRARATIQGSHSASFVAAGV
jgi:hypothetical protein